MYGPGKRPTLTPLALGAWINLERCEQCGAIWCISPYEPYAAFEYGVLWEHGPDKWRELHEADGGRTLLRWHAAAIAAGWVLLPEAEREQIDAHRRRSYGHNPIDSPAVFGADDLPGLLRQMQLPPLALNDSNPD